MEHSGDGPYNIEIEIENRHCKILELLKDRGIGQFRVEDIRGLAEGAIRHLVRIPSKQLEMLSIDTTIKIEQKNDNETSVWYNSDGCDVCNTILSHGSFLVSGGIIEENIISYNFIVPNYEAFQNITTELEDRGLQLKILKMERYEPKGEILTKKQERILWHALKTGFFEYPRKINTIELSRKMGIVPSTLSEITRRGMRRLLENHFKPR